MNKNEELLPYYEKLKNSIYWLDGKPYWIKNDKVAGSPNINGYRHICCTIKSKRHLIKAHRLNWYMNYNKLPNGIVDHIDRNKDNNSIQNLRIVTRSQNILNSKTSGKSKYKGVSQVFGGKWISRLQINKKRRRLGLFDCEHCAGLAYDQALIKYGLAEYGNFNLLRNKL